MDAFENVASYLTRISQVKDKFATVGEKVDGSELVRIVVDGMTK